VERRRTPVELADAVAAFLASGRQSVARLNCEPEEYELVFESGTRQGELRVKAVLYPQGRGTKSASEIVLVHEGEATQIGRTFWRALRKLESRFDSRHWSHGFPSQIVESLGALTKQQPRSSPSRGAP
jgi:hypothetical protein